MPDHQLPSDAFQVFNTNSYSSGPEATSQPIPADLFAEAIKDLPPDTLYSKAAEIQNSVSHLLASNIQMKPFADEGDEVCKEAMAENDEVLKRMEERIGLLKAEAEQRGLRWSTHAVGTDGSVQATTNGHSTNGRLTDEELRQRLEAQMAEDNDDDDDGVHL